MNNLLENKKLTTVIIIILLVLVNVTLYLESNITKDMNNDITYYSER